MAKKDWKAKAKTLKKQMKTLLADWETRGTALANTVAAEASHAASTAAAAMKSIKPGKSISPLAPKDGFPKIPAIAGVEFSAAAAGVKYQNRKDVMLVRLAPGTAIAGVFTKSSTRAACVLDCQAKLAMKVPADAGAAVVVNSGNANAFTGALGQKSVDAVTGGVAKSLGIPASRVFSSSTGVIGEPLPHERILNALPALVGGLQTEAVEMAAQAIMTTDTFAKGATATVNGDGGPIHIAGIAKGSGMIAPDMATMLVYIFTDARITPAALQKMLARNVDSTFNAITVDSDTSTSDALLLCATGQSTAAAIKGPVSKAFEAALHDVMLDLAKQVTRDGEGATKLVEVQVTGAATEKDAHLAAMAIANSPLVK
ncbi:bifunctional glutamate N-acetyltransferase/amino-acid acetyltransferase ArgJ, partial [Pseudorhodobacter sp.]|uniref:bifunctional glutamate N-acetyltransferase/amino-acid acetyltransferase ArgJ n=1 Tax=Pseudorhodobacter sp. TaxID=1934400 RepID=UPI0026479EF2